jgi:flavin-dependent dehydrogenase
MAAQKTVRIEKSVPVAVEVDVLVAGSGIAGSTAAVTAARCGARTMVVDRFGRPGGNMGPGWIGGAPNLELPGSMVETGIPGIPGEFVRRCEEYGNAPLLNHYFRDSQAISYVWLQMMQESGVELMFNTFVSDPIMNGDRIEGLIVENKSGSQAVKAKVVVDATGDADIAARLHQRLLPRQQLRPHLLQCLILSISFLKTVSLPTWKI